METKHTKEYAEKLALNNALFSETAFVQGCMKAIEETAYRFLKQFEHLIIQAGDLV